MAVFTTRPATDSDFDAIVAFDGRSFGDPWTKEQQVAVRPTLELDRFRLAHDGDQLIGVGGLYTQELTVPGGAIVPSAGVTWVSVAATHRRRGVLTQLMADLHDDVDAHGEPIAMLMASEGGIYARFGYGVATHWRLMELDRRLAAFRPEYRPEPGSVMLTTADDERIIALFDRYRRQRVGELRRSAERYALSAIHRGPGQTIAIHADGYAAWKIKPEWNSAHPAHELTVLDMVAITPEAHAALWYTVLSVDLVGPIRSDVALAIDDTLPYLLTDPRVLRTTGLNDMMWLHLRDVAHALRARTYGSDDELVIDVDLGDRTERWKVSGSPAGAEVRRTRRRPDLTMNRASLGAIYLGGVRPSTLVRAGLVTVARPDVARRADIFFATDRQPHCTTGF